MSVNGMDIVRHISEGDCSDQLPSKKRGACSGATWVALLTFLAGFFGVAFFVVDVGPFSLFPYRFLLLVLMGMFVLSVFTTGWIWISRVSRIRWYLTFLGMWCVYAAVSLSWAISVSEAIRHMGLVWCAAGTVFLLCYYCSTKTAIKAMYRIWILGLGVLLIIGLWEHLTGQHLLVSGFYGETRSGLMHMPTGVFNNSNDYALFLSLSIPFALALTRYARRALTKALGICMACLGGYLICAAGSRANLIAVLLELGFLFLFLMRSASRMKVIVVVCTCLCIAVLMAPNVVESVSADIGGQLTSIAAQAKANVGSIAVRMNLVRNGLSFLVTTGGFGVGGGNAEVWMASRAIYDTRGILNPHNWWLEIIVNYGILIFVGYVLFYVNLIWNLWRRWKILSTRTDKMIAEALLLSLVGFALASISSSSIMALTPQWLLFAFALSFLSYTWRKESVRR